MWRTLQSWLCRGQPDLNRDTNFSGFVDAGSIRSFGVMSPSSSPRFPALVSEQTANVLRDSSASVAHSISDCDRSEIEGVRNRTEPLTPASCSAILSAVRVLPEPQAHDELAALVILEAVQRILKCLLLKVPQVFGGSQAQ